MRRIIKMSNCPLGLTPASSRQHKNSKLVYRAASFNSVLSLFATLTGYDAIRRNKQFGREILCAANFANLERIETDSGRDTVTLSLTTSWPIPPTISLSPPSGAIVPTHCTSISLATGPPGMLGGSKLGQACRSGRSADRPASWYPRKVREGPPRTRRHKAGRRSTGNSRRPGLQSAIGRA